MFAWYITRVKNPKGGVTYQVRYVLHYQLENRPTPSTPEPTALAPMPSAQSAPDPVRHPRPVTVRHNDGNSYQCEMCGCSTVKKYPILIPKYDINDDNDDPRYVSMCNRECCRNYQNWCKSLIPGLQSNLLHMTFNGICVPGDGGVLHDEWCVQFVLVKEGRRTGMNITPYNNESVKWGRDDVTPVIHMSLNRLRKICSKP